MERNAKRLYIIGNALLPVFAVLILLVRPLSKRLPVLFGGCFLHDWLHLYCAFCGGTRAMEDLVRLNVVEALRHNALVVLLVLCFLIWDVTALIRMLKGHARWWAIPQKSGLIVTVALVAYLVVRNVMMIVWQYDPVGDLGRFWL